MKFLVRWLFRLFVVLVVLVVALVLLKDVLLKSFTEYQIRNGTGMDVKIGRFETGLFSPMLTIENMTIYNRPEFGGAPFLVVPDLHLEWEARALAARRLHLKLVRLAVTELNIVEGRDGRSNLVLNLDSPESIIPPSRRSDPGTILGFEFAGIDTLNLTLGKVTYSSLRRPGQRGEVKLGLKHEMITGIKSLSDLADSVMRVLLRNGITITQDGPTPRSGLTVDQEATRAPAKRRSPEGRR